MSNPEYDAENRCTLCGAHFAEPHGPDCPRGGGVTSSMSKDSDGTALAGALGASAAEADQFADWFAHMWPDDNAALAFNAWLAARRDI